MRVTDGKIPHPELRKSTAERIRARRLSDGRPLDLTRTGPEPGHYTLLLPSPPTPDDLDSLVQLFDPPQPNPARAEVRGNA
jgi:hypothetical protein